MNAGVGLVQAFLHCLPLASHVVSRGRPGPADDLRLQTDPRLAPALSAVDVLVAEVKEGKARLNDATRTARVMESALTRVGCVPDAVMEATVERGAAPGTIPRRPPSGGLADPVLGLLHLLRHLR